MTEERSNEPSRRIEALEHRGRARHLLIVLLVAGALLAGWMGGRASPSDSEGERRGRYLLVDGSGEIRAALTMARDSAVALSLHDADGRIRLILGVNSDGSPFIRMLNEFGNPAWTAP